MKRIMIEFGPFVQRNIILLILKFLIERIIYGFLFDCKNMSNVKAENLF